MNIQLANEYQTSAVQHALKDSPAEGHIFPTLSEVFGYAMAIDSGYHEPTSMHLELMDNGDYILAFVPLGFTIENSIMEFIVSRHFRGYYIEQQC